MKVAVPPDRACVTSAPPSTLKLTLPDGAPAAELTVTVTTPFCPKIIGGALIVVVVTNGGK